MSQLHTFQDALETAINAVDIVADNELAVLKERGPGIESEIDEALARLNAIILIGSPSLRNMSGSDTLPNYRVRCNVFFGSNQVLAGDDAIEMTDVLEACLIALHTKAAEAKNRAAAWRITEALPSDDDEVYAYALTIETAFFFSQSASPLPVTT